MSYAVSKIRLHSSLANLGYGYLQSWRLPVPSTITYLDHTARSDKADGGQHLRGRGSVRFMWDTLTRHQTRTVRDIAEFDTVYVTINKSWNGSGGAGEWSDGHGKGLVPRAIPAGNTNGEIFENVVLEVRNFIIDNEVASF